MPKEHIISKKKKINQKNEQSHISRKTAEKKTNPKK